MTLLLTFVIAILIIIISILVYFIIWQRKYFYKKLPGRPSGFMKRKEKALEYLMKNKKITNDIYQEITGISDSTATEDLDKLEKEGIIKQVGETGKGVYYEFTNG